MVSALQLAAGQSGGIGVGPIDDAAVHRPLGDLGGNLLHVGAVSETAGGGQGQMDQLEAEGFLLDGSRSDLLENTVVLAVPEDDPAGRWSRK